MKESKRLESIKNSINSLKNLPRDALIEIDSETIDTIIIELEKSYEKDKENYVNDEINREIDNFAWNNVPKVETFLNTNSLDTKIKIGDEIKSYILNNVNNSFKYEIKERLTYDIISEKMSKKVDELNTSKHGPSFEIN